MLQLSFVLYTYRKPYMGFQLVMLPLTLGDLERSNQRPLIFKTQYLYIICMLQARFVIFIHRKPYVGFQLVMLPLTMGDPERSNQRSLIFNAPYLHIDGCYMQGLYYAPIGNF